jgi:hypothetical protein
MDSIHTLTGNFLIMLYPKTTLLMSMLSLSSFSVFADNVPNAGLLLQQQTIQQYQPQAEVNIGAACTNANCTSRCSTAS